MTAVQLCRTDPFELIPVTRLSSGHLARLVQHPAVEVPGLARRPGGTPVTVPGTVYDIVEIEHDYVTAHVDYDYDPESLHYFGNHTLAEGPLREILPDAYPLPDYPTKREARDAVRRLLTMSTAGGFVVESDLRSSRALYVTPPMHVGGDQLELDKYFARLNEYVPFRAELAWCKVDGEHAIRIRPKGESA